LRLSALQVQPAVCRLDPDELAFVSEVRLDPAAGVAVAGR
jgi:hypothetical protein